MDVVVLSDLSERDQELVQAARLGRAVDCGELSMDELAVTANPGRVVRAEVIRELLLGRRGGVRWPVYQIDWSTQVTRTTDGSRPAEEPAARQAMRELAAAGVLDEVMGRVDRDGLALTGRVGFLPELVKAVLSVRSRSVLPAMLGRSPSGGSVTCSNASA